jgi:hypothetical protein
VIYALHSSTDMNFGGGARAITRMTYRITAVNSGDDSWPLDAIAGWFDVLLHRQKGTAGGYVIAGCLRIEQLTSEYVQEGVTYNHKGGFYRIDAYLGVAQ